MRDVTLTSLQLLLNRLAEEGFSKSAVGQIRTYIKSCFEYAVDEDLISKSRPASSCDAEDPQEAL